MLRGWRSFEKHLIPQGMEGKVNKWILVGGGVVLILVIPWLVFAKGKAPRKVKVKNATNVEAQQLYTQAAQFRRENNPLKAREAYQTIMKTYPEFENVSSVQKELEELNMNLLFSNKEIPGKTVVHEVTQGDTLGKIAKRYGSTVDLIKRSNNIKGDVIRLGQKLRVWQGHFNIYVDKSQNKLYLKDGNDLMKVYTVSTGANNSTPVGNFKIISKLVDPVWFNRGIVVPPESPENVLGTRWLGFDIPGYGIHGTVEPEAIGQQVTAGCVRMRNEEVEELYSIVPVGTEVQVVD